MSIGLIIFLIILFIIAMGATIFALKQEERKMRTYEEEGQTAQDELKRSIEYESKSLKTNVPILTWIYSITILLVLIVFTVYLV